MKQCGLFANVLFENQKFIFLVDTGSAVSCISKLCYDKLKSDVKIEPISTNLVAASGENLKVYGLVKLPFKINEVLFEQEFVIVDLDISGILGIDLLNTSEAQIKSLTYFA